MYFYIRIYIKDRREKIDVERKKKERKKKKDR